MNFAHPEILTVQSLPNLVGLGATEPAARHGGAYRRDLASMERPVSATAGMSLKDLLGLVAHYTDDVVIVTEAAPLDVPGPQIVYVNPSFSRMTGYSAEEAIGKTPRMLQGSKTSRNTCDEIRAALTAWRPIRTEILNYRKDRTEFWVELSITPVADDAGCFRYWVSVQREVSERQRFDEQRRMHELILANVDEGIFVADALGQGCPIEFINAGFSRMTGYSQVDLAGLDWRAVLGMCVSPDAAGAGRSAGAGASDDRVSMETISRRKDGTSFSNLICLSSLRSAQGEVVKFVGVMRDLTNEKLREKEFMAAQRLRAVGEMTGGIAHDFNNLLTAIGGAAELLAQRTHGDLALSELVATIRGAAGRGTSQVRRLLGFSRTPLLTRGTVDLSAVLKQLQLLLATLLREDIVLAVDEDPGSRWIDADAVQLEGALLNLVLNAQGAIVKTGRIRVSARPVVVDGDAMVRIEVSDNGQGMDEATRARIFEPFFTTKVQGRGSGLGLAMVKAFARQFGGSITLDSVLGQGSTFALTLPAAPDGATDFGELASVALAAPCCYSVLLVEDDDVVRITARAMLELLGHKVQECSNAELALQVLDANKRFQILFTDIMMPGRMSGIELAAAARQRCASLKVILTSGWAGTDLPEDFKIEPSETFVLKPYSLEDLSAAIAKAGGSDT